MANTGRPSLFSNELADTICSRLADARSLRSICLDGDMPCQTTVFKWLRENEAFAQQYARAREVQADALFDEMLDIADDGTNDWMERKRQDGSTEEVLNGEHVQRTRLRLDTRKWMAAKLAPKKYGEHSKVELTGADGGPVQIAQLPPGLSEATLRELAAIPTQPQPEETAH